MYIYISIKYIQFKYVKVYLRVKHLINFDILISVLYTSLYAS